MEERAFGLLMLILALPCCLPFVYLLPQIVSLPMVFLAFQMAQGRRSPWLPETLRKRTMPVKSLLDVTARTKRYAGWLERLAHPRLAGLTGPSGLRVLGAILIVPCLSILVPLAADQHHAGHRRGDRRRRRDRARRHLRRARRR
jgi:hypothetical protein